eukprot:5794495-Prymnesium_polylepis.2
MIARPCTLCSSCDSSPSCTPGCWSTRRWPPTAGTRRCCRRTAARLRAAQHPAAALPAIALALHRRVACGDACGDAAQRAASSEVALFLLGTPINTRPI